MSSSSLLATAVGVTCHVLYFRIGEHHMLPIVYVQLFAFVCLGSSAALVHFSDATFLDALATVSTLAFYWLVGVYGSLIVYRLFFHPLNKFPGPWQARLGDMCMSIKLKDLKAYRTFTDLHKQHGQYIRIGSNTLSITDPRIMQPAYGAQAGVTKADWYDGPSPHDSMHTTRDKGLHDRRRRVWAPAFSDKALREYEKTVAVVNEKLVQRLSDFKGSAINATTWFNLYSFDVMGRLAFGRDYGMVDSGNRHWALDLLTESMKFSGFRFPTWVFRLLLAIPGAAADYHKFFDFCTEQLTSRVQKGPGDRDDITGWLLKAYADDKHPENDPLLQADTRLIIIAGSDTTSATLTYLFYHLALDSSLQEKLRTELRPLTTGDWSDKDIQNANHLNGAINETLRMYPPIPSGLLRKTAPQGLHVGDVFLPGNTVFSTPQYSMGRDDRIYPDADSFIPERWYSRPDLIKHPNAFAPFSMGPFNCIGRNLARMELRTLTAQLLLHYKITLAPGEDGSRLLGGMVDHFTVSLKPLNLEFTPLCE